MLVYKYECECRYFQFCVLGGRIYHDGKLNLWCFRGLGNGRCIDLEFLVTVSFPFGLGASIAWMNLLLDLVLEEEIRFHTNGEQYSTR
jgi:hypothetical protein